MDSLYLLATVVHHQTESAASDLKAPVNTQQTGRSAELTNAYAEAWNQVRNLGSSKVDAAQPRIEKTSNPPRQPGKKGPNSNSGDQSSVGH